jgi:hypothetical protein
MEMYLNYFKKLYLKKLEKIQMKQERENYIQNNSKKMLHIKPTNNEHLVNSNLKESFLQRQINKIPANTTSSQSKLPDNSSAGTNSTSSHNDILLALSPISNSNISLNNYHQRDPKYQSNRPQSPEIQNINDEIIGKIQKGEPLLFPPKDYTQTLVQRGHLADAQYRRSRNPLILGDNGIKMREKNLENLEFIDSRSHSPMDRNDLDYNEQEVLNMLDEVVDSVSMSEYRYNPISEPSKYAKSSRSQDAYESDYEIYSDYAKSPLHMIEEEEKNGSQQHLNKNPESEYYIKRNMSNIKDVARKHNRYTNNVEVKNKPEPQNQSKKKIFNFSKSDKELNTNTSDNFSLISAANIGIRANALTKLGNWRPKIIEVNQQQQQTSNRFNPISSTSNVTVYSPYSKDSASSSGLRRISEETNNLYTSYNNVNHSEFILKKTDFKAYENYDEKNSNNKKNFKNYVNVQDSNRFNNQSNNLLGTLINIYPTNNANKKMNNNFKDHLNQNNNNNNVINVYELNRRYDHNEKSRYDMNEFLF